MTIKQQGGVFGRNPSFNDVSIDTLTVDGSASVNGPLDCDGFTSNGQSNFVGTLGSVFVDSQGAFLNFTRNSGNYIRTTGLSSSLYINTALKNRIGILNTGDILFYKDDGTTVGATWDASAGNLAFASGNGIDFSATAGTGTSELFDDYEEGTFTPTVEGTTTAGTGTYVGRAGYYTKIGNVVHFNIYFNMSAHTGTGNMIITGLPFTSKTVAGFSAGSAHIARSASGFALPSDTVFQGNIARNSSTLDLYTLSTTGGGTSSALPIDTAFAVNIAGSYFST